MASPVAMKSTKAGRQLSSPGGLGGASHGALLALMKIQARRKKYTQF